ncbi:MAG: valine--tRNA ligase [bacterium]|nr:valine--tRNA ligase [bacterium]
MLEKQFKPGEAEQRIYQQWEDAGAFKSQPDRVAAGAKSYCIVIPPPNVTGSLHMGHALNNTVQDILIRFERMRGKDVLWQPGMDHAGIATQMVVERQLARNNEPGRSDMGRDAFIERVWEWKAKSGGIIINQLRRLGASCDWSRERFTMDEGLSKAVRKVFVELYEADLIYRDKRLVNWDPVFQTAISDLEVENIEVDGHFWHFKYPLENGETYEFPIAHDNEGEPTEWETRDYISIATTRPETMLGDGAVAVHPSDTRYAPIVGKRVLLPLADRYIPIITDEHPDPDFGSGAVKITGAHDFNDYAVARRHDLPLLIIMDEQGAMAGEIPKKYIGMDRFEARKLIVEDIDKLGLLLEVEDKKVMQPFGDRSHAVIEPMLTDQWYVNAKKLAEPAIAAVKDGRTKFVPSNWDKTYFQWMDNIEPWCISRQLWWGHRIPVWYGPDEKVFVAYTSAEAKEQAAKHYSKTVELRQDPDVLDTWFSSGLWAFSTLGWPDKTPELKRYYQTDVLVTGFDIIFFWVARMMMMGMHFMDEVPFHTVYVHALVRDEKGAKMSKSKGNVMDPLDLLDGIDLEQLVDKRTIGLVKKDAKAIAKSTRKEYPDGIPSFGADVLRFTLAAMAAQGRDVRMSLPRVEGYRNFSTKLWNAARFTQMNECVRQQGFDPSSCNATINKWIAGEMQKASNAVTLAIELHRYNEAASAIYNFIWHVYCDWYLEMIKTVLNGNDAQAQAEARAMAAFVLDQILKLLHPFMPFITEELWQKLVEQGPERESLLILAQWPTFSGLEDEAVDREVDWLIRLITEVRSVRAEMNVPAGTKVPLIFTGAGDEVKGWVKTHNETLRRIARLEELSFSADIPDGAIQMILDDVTIAMSLEGIIDVEAEQARLNKDIDKQRGDIKKIEAKLGNENFTARAPAEVVEEQKRRKSDAEQAVEKLLIALKRVEALG